MKPIATGHEYLKLPMTKRIVLIHIKNIQTCTVASSSQKFWRLLHLKYHVHAVYDVENWCCWSRLISDWWWPEFHDVFYFCSSTVSADDGRQPTGQRWGGGWGWPSVGPTFCVLFTPHFLSRRSLGLGVWSCKLLRKRRVSARILLLHGKGSHVV